MSEPIALFAHVCEVCGQARMRRCHRGWYRCTECGHRWLPLADLEAMTERGESIWTPDPEGSR